MIAPDRVGFSALAIGLVVLLLAVVVCWSGKVTLATLPAPTGDHPVGTTVMTLANDIPVRVWYPAVPGSLGRRAPYRFRVEGGPLRARIVSRFIWTGAALDLPVAAGKHPVLVYAPSWGGYRTENTAQAQNLASHGFIVVAMDDLYPDKAMEMSSEQTFRETLRWADRKARLQAVAALHVVDALDVLANGRGDGLLAGHLDMQRAGMFGFSFGGAVAAEAATLDGRIRAAANLDGWMFSDAAAQGVPRPFLIMSADDLPSVSTEHNGSSSEEHYAGLLDQMDIKRIYAGFRKHGGYFLVIRGTDHRNFSDAALIPSLRKFGIGPIDKDRANAVVAAYLVEFFNRFLNRAAAPLLESKQVVGPRRYIGPSMDPAARLEIWTAPHISDALPKCCSAAPEPASKTADAGIP